MDAKRLASLNYVSSTFARWKTVHDEVSALEDLLNAELRLHAKGSCPFPEALFAQVQRLRHDAEHLFDVATGALRASQY